MGLRQSDFSPKRASVKDGRTLNAVPVLVVALAVAVFVNFFLARLRSRVDSLTTAHFALQSMQDNVTDLAASQNDLLNPYSTKEKVYSDIAKYQTKASSTLSQVEGQLGYTLPNVRGKLNSFVKELNDEASLVRKEQGAQAASRDASCDALEEATDGAIDSEEAILSVQMEQAERLADVGSFALIILVALGGAVGFLRLEQARRKAAQIEARKQVESRYQAIIRNAPILIALLDEQNRFTYVSEGVRQVAGWTPKDFLGDSIARFLTEDHQPDILTIVNGVRSEPGKNLTFEATILDTSGSVRDVEILINNLSQNPEVQGLVFVCRDITERKKALLEISHARDAALEAIKTKSEFLANMSHEIRTPMNGVIGMVDIMMDTPLNDEQKQFMEIVRTSAESLLSIINSILDFSKTEAGKLELELAPFSLRSLVEDVADAMAIQAHSKQVEIIVRAPSHSAFMVNADGLRIRQILTNLAGNALKFTERGEIVLGIKKLKQTDSHFDLRLSVEDTGIGISEQNISKIFDVFTQADGSMTRKYGGTGLGLSISQAMAGLMGSEIQCTSKIGEGSLFWLDVTLERSAREESVDAVPIASLHGLTALIVDDNAVNRQILTEFLTSWGCTVALAEGGEVACRLVADAADRPFNLILLDYQMPDMDGFETAERIKEMGFNSIILMLSSVDANRLHGKLADVGIRRRLVKPVRKDQLHAAIIKALEEDAATPFLGSALTTTASECAINLNVLLVEDNPTNQTVGTLLLKRLGCRVTLAHNGLEGVIATDLEDFDLVLMDCEMPIKDGYQATREIREREMSSKKRVPILALTAHALAGMNEKCLAAGMDGYLTKPVTLDSLSKGLRPWVELVAA